MNFDSVYYERKEAEALGLKIVCTLDEGNLSYEYNTLLIVHHAESNRLFMAQDSGCSCPTPFECHYWNSVDDNSLDEITKDNLAQRLDELAKFPVSITERRDAENTIKGILYNTKPVATKALCDRFGNPITVGCLVTFPTPPRGSSLDMIDGRVTEVRMEEDPYGKTPRLHPVVYLARLDDGKITHTRLIERLTVVYTE